MNMLRNFINKFLKIFLLFISLFIIHNCKRGAREPIMNECRYDGYFKIYLDQLKGIDVNDPSTYLDKYFHDVDCDKIIGDSSCRVNYNYNNDGAGRVIEKICAFVIMSDQILVFAEDEENLDFALNNKMQIVPRSDGSQYEVLYLGCLAKRYNEGGEINFEDKKIGISYTMIVSREDDDVRCEEFDRKGLRE